MPNAKQLKDSLAAFITERQRELNELDKRTAVERTRLELQIEQASKVLNGWEKQVSVDDLVNALSLAGVQIRTD